MTVALSITDLQKTYPNGLVALRGIDLQVEEGDFFALLGKNGAGKSTAIGIISSLVNKSGGKVRVFDADIDRDFARAKSYLGVVPQEFNFSIFETPMQIVCNQAGYYGIGRKLAEERAGHYLRQLGLWEKREQMAQTLSGGMKRRLMIARALMHEPRLLILDEPTAGVDIEIRRSMWNYLTAINQSGTTIILTTHYLEEAESLCRNIAIIDRGRLVENTGMRELLGKLQTDAYVLDLAEPLRELPRGLPSSWELTGPNVLEADVPATGSLDALFETLAGHNIKVRSMRNKTNRLEQLFLDMVEEEGA
ncbi:MAG: ABC transporter ATP-binding protein [Gammaproteobacteria bacterium]|nr:ABC transporter ATP-binding protein [Gammaproteobacteria bacterium]MDA7972220.1 ABC transporter ATP-binding protein [Gammaproteobacteria bacterium]MDA7995647.1 ABC transporter ATP-binding protein [Gammaproteobacteria bacterium]MDA8023162.1 ABC transporter ATP-binding protein [Gammaproteobacteria bacterium]